VFFELGSLQEGAPLGATSFFICASAADFAEFFGLKFEFNSDLVRHSKRCRAFVTSSDVNTKNSSN
jgi:hypothetical protein